MAEIVKFPTVQVITWVEFERGLRSFAVDSGMSAEAEAALLARMEPFLKLLDLEFSVTIPAGTPATLEQECEAFAVDLK